MKRGEDSRLRICYQQGNGSTPSCFYLHDLLIISYLLLFEENFGDVFHLDSDGKFLPDDLDQHLLDFWCLKYVLGCQLCFCPCDDPGLRVFATFCLGEKEEEEEVREDLHGQGAGRAVWTVRDRQHLYRELLSLHSILALKF